MRIKKGDNVQIMVGAAKGKQGKVVVIDNRKNRIIVEGLNLIKKHQRPKKQGEKGEIISIPRSLNASNALIVCSSCSKPARMGFREDNGEKIRYCKKCKNPA